MLRLVSAGPVALGRLGQGKGDVGDVTLTLMGPAVTGSFLVSLEEGPKFG